MLKECVCVCVCVVKKFQVARMVGGKNVFDL